MEKIILRQEDRLDVLAEVYDRKQDAQMRGLRRRRHTGSAPLSKRSSQSSNAVPSANQVSHDGHQGQQLGPPAAKGTWKTPETDGADRFVSNKASYPTAAAGASSKGWIGSGIGSTTMEISASGTEQEVYNGIRLVVSKGNPARDTRFVEMRKRIERLGETPFRVPTNAFDEDVGGVSLNIMKSPRQGEADHSPRGSTR